MLGCSVGVEVGHHLTLSSSLPQSVETTDQDTDWSSALATYIRHNDQAMLEAADKMLELFESDLLLSTSFGEFADAADLLRGPAAIADPDTFLKDALRLPD